jgi:hypothetical protein
VTEALRGLADQLDPAELQAVAGPARAELGAFCPRWPGGRRGRWQGLGRRPGRPGAAVRAAARAGPAAGGARAAAADRGGPALGRPLHPPPARLPGHLAALGAGAGGGYLPQRRAGPAAAGHPDANHLAAARPIVAGNPIATAILDRAAALLDDDHERLLTTATAFETAGCPYQRARTLILAGGDTASTGNAALVDLGLTPAAATG